MVAQPLTFAEAASASVDDVLATVESSHDGLTSTEAAARLQRDGPNAVRTERVRAIVILAHQLNNAVLILLAGTAVASVFLGDRTQAAIIGIILLVSISLGFVNEYRAQRATEAMHSRVRHTTVVQRDGQFTPVDVGDLVTGDVIRLTLGEAVPADLRLISVDGLSCNEGLLTGESVSADKQVDPVPEGTAMADATDLAFMGTIVTAGSGVGVVYATGASAEFGRIAASLDTRAPETPFQLGLRKFSYLLLWVAVVLTIFILLTNLLMRRPVIDSLLFALAIAVGITPQLLPAVVSSSLANGSAQLAKRKVLVKRLVCIEDLGDVDVLVTDKTGTLTEGHISFGAAVDPAGNPDPTVLRLGLLSTDVDPATGGASGNDMDDALWQAPAARADGQPITQGCTRIALLAFDHTRRMTSTVVEVPGAQDQRLLVTKGAPEQVMVQCVDLPSGAQRTLDGLFEQGLRVVAVASRPAPGLTAVHPDDERALHLAGFLCFADNPKEAARDSLRQLHDLQIEVKVATGDNAQVAQKVCADLGLVSKGAITGSQIDALHDDAAFDEMVANTTVFARVTPEQKARIVRSARGRGRSVAFLGDGVNDAPALHAADVGISVDSATDVAKDAADVVLLDKDLGVLADGVAQGRRIFANTIKYVLMGTSSNFGNMFSAAAASAFLTFLPMLPGQILLNNLLYDSSQLAIPTDRVDAEQLRAPSHWDVGFIRRFMLTFGPISSLFDFLTFALMLTVLHAGPPEFRTGWFVESLATQTLIIFAIRTRRIPFLRSKPSLPLVFATTAAIAVGVGITLSPLAAELGFTSLPLAFYLALVGLTIAYLLLVEATKKVFYDDPMHLAGPRPRIRGQAHRIDRRAARFTQHAGS
ncbi:magnesium-translocating P-type ATPase [Branchiibius sp. NY16-3462-2]|nr:magnesium-translocating P-type ATPase [Branchiibius sp. NY16-3462-2]